MTIIFLFFINWLHKINAEIEWIIRLRHFDEIAGIRLMAVEKTAM